MEKRHASRIFFAISAVILILGYMQIYQSNQQEKFSPYYQILADACKAKATSECCLSSVKIMSQYNYTQATATGCPKGFSVNTNKCVDSLQWCEPN